MPFLTVKQILNYHKYVFKLCTSLYLIRCDFLFDLIQLKYMAQPQKLSKRMLVAAACWLIPVGCIDFQPDRVSAIVTSYTNCVDLNSLSGKHMHNKSQ